MAAKNLSDEELRRRLEKLGVRPGPITDSTRALYLSKLEQKTGHKKRQSHELPSGDGAPTAQRPSVGSHSWQQDVPRSNGLSCMPPPVARLHGSTTVQGPPARTAETSGHLASRAQVVVDRQLASLNSPSHLASDTVFIFPDGEVFLASRAVLAIQCSELTPLLYSREEPFPVNIATLSGQVVQFFVRPSELVADLKEKLSLAQGISVTEQRLVFMNNEIHNPSTIATCGVGAGATIHLVLVAAASPTPSTCYFTSVINPALSISHLSLGLGLEQLASTQRNPLHQPPRVPLPPHVTHIVHIHDIPSEGFKLFLQYLYSGELTSANSLTAYVCCYVLGEYFKVSSLPLESLAYVQERLTVQNALVLTQFAENIQSQALHNICVGFLQANQQQK